MLLSLAYVLLFLSALLILGWPLLWAGPGRRLETLSGPEARFFASMAGAACLIVLSAPTLAVLALPGADAVFAAFDAALSFTFAL
ncbi:MAG: hypothetical protein AAGH87_09035 [Pseudomonadota bacterium]